MMNSMARGLCLGLVGWLLLDAAEAAPQNNEPEMSWLDNGVIRVGVDLQLGGAITWVSRSGETLNVINSWDWGRQVQMSYYSGPVPFIVGEKHPAKAWEGLGWNPIQVGDCFGHRSQLLEKSNDGKTLYVKCVPMQWPLENVPGECTFESWLELEGSVVHARCRLQNARADHTQYPARGQELPAVYTNGPFHRLMSYTGLKPFTQDGVTELEAKPPPQWAMWDATENWSALVNDQGWGLGVWNPGCTRFGGGFNSKPGVGGPKDDPCGYIAPNRVEMLDHNITHEFRYDLVLGTVDEIRAHVYRQPRPAEPSWIFAKDREGWSYHNAVDTGWPIQGELNVALTEADPSIISPRFFSPVETARVLVFEAAFAMPHPHPQIFWSTVDQPGFSEKNSVRFTARADGQFHEYRIPLGDAPGYQGGVTQLRIDPADDAGGAIRVRSVRLTEK